MRRATIPQYGQRIAVGISIHALHEESDLRGPEPEGGVILISIHALHEESDFTGCAMMPAHCISIHALHEESDVQPDRPSTAPVDFNPRSP